ncbi:MAG: glycosyltransferase [Thermoguttaceae bacterium]|nr:glycosyltransferase [Thermoguttaceae bacterium]
MSCKLSVISITFNHAQFIRQALDGFIMQKTSFPFEVLIHDDASTDGTADIIREYAEKFPGIIKPIFQTENQFSKINFQFLPKYIFPLVQGKYVAFCEGDDYWTDPLKLQKQVDFLDAHPECSMCFHTAEEIWENEPDRRDHLPKGKFYKGNRTFFNAEDLLHGLWIATASTVFRWVFHDKEKLDSWSNIINADTYLFFLHAKYGKIGYIKDVMSVYRHQPTGIWQGTPLLKYLEKNLYSRDLIDKMYDFKYHRLISKCKRDIVLRAYRQSLSANDFERFNALGMPIPKFLVQPPFTTLLRCILPDSDSGFRVTNFNRLVIALGYIFNIRWIEKMKNDDYSA